MGAAVTERGLSARVADVLRDRFPGADLHLEEDPSSGALSGFVVWGGFRDEETPARQRQVWDHLRGALGASEAGRIRILMTMTPESWAVYQEEKHAS